MNTRNVLVLVVFVSLACQLHAQGTPTIKREEAKPTNPGSGSEMYASYCAACHGPTAKGNGPAAPALKKQPADLTLLSKKNGGKFPSMQVMNTIKGSDVLSHGSRDMPIWGKIFSEMDDQPTTELRVYNLTQFIESLQQK